MKKVYFILGHILLGAAAIAAFSTATMFLWNWLMPAIFGLTAICFWQALGLLVICRILFGGMGGMHHFIGMHHFGRMRHHNLIREKWLKMTPEEQKEFLKNRRFGHGFVHGFSQNDKSEKQE